MKTILHSLFAVMLGLGAGSTALLAQTDGGAKLEVTLLNYGTGTQDDHWTVAWVATESGTFIKTLRKQGPNFTDTHWRDHCLVWWNAKGANNTLDGYSSATARDYAGTNSPVILTWNGRDASGTLMPDGNYTFWVQYAENGGQGPYTTSGLLWTKAPTGATNPYPNQAVNFSNMKVTWTPVVVTVAPIITSAPPIGTGTVGVAYNFTVTASGTPAPTFSATGLPPGLTISPAGVISGIPTTASTFTGTITAANGVAPDATQAFTITINAAPAAPLFTSAPPTGTGTVGIAYNFTVTASGNPAPTFTATGLPAGLTISPAGVISGIPTTANTFTGTITAANGVAPDATQAFTIVISDVPPVTIVSVRTEGSNLVLSGTGPANATYHVLSSSDLALPTAQWTSVATNSIDSSGNFSVTIPTSAGVSQSFTKLRVP